jgi:outer membrane biosynthesis protein TonB
MFVNGKCKVESGKLYMKKNLILLTVLSLAVSVFAFEYKPKNIDENPFAGSNTKTNIGTNSVTKKAEPAAPEMREIKNLAEYFKYLPREVQRHWKPYKAEKDYEIVVQFTVHRDGSITVLQIIGTNYPNANQSVLNAVKSGAPYQPLPKSFERESVKAQIFLEYHKQQDEQQN